MTKLNYKLLNVLILTAILTLLYLIKDLWIDIVNRIFTVTFPFILAFAAAYALYPLLKWLEKKLPKAIAVIIIVLGLIGVLVFTIVLLMPILIDQLEALTSFLIKTVKDISTNTDLQLGFAQDFLKDIYGMLGDLGKEISNISISVIMQTINIAVILFVAFIIMIYFLADMDNIRAKIKKYFKSKNKKTYRYVKTLDTEISNYFIGFWKVMLVQMIEYILVFKIIGHPYYLILGFLAAASTIIPYFGGMIVNVLALITAFFISKELFILCIIVMLIFPQLDSYVINPIIYGNTNNLPALLTIFAVFAGSALLGFMGIIIALPLTVIILTTYKFYHGEMKEKLTDLKHSMDVESND